MPPALVDSVADKVDDLSESEAKDIYEEVKKSLREDGEIPDNEDDMTEQDWGLLVEAFLTTISARFDVDKGELTQEQAKEFLRGRTDFFHLVQS